MTWKKLLVLLRFGSLTSKSVHCSCPDGQHTVLHIIDYTVQKFKNISWWQTDNCEVASPLRKFVYLSSLSWLITTGRAVSSYSYQYPVELLTNLREIHSVWRRFPLGAFSRPSRGFSCFLGFSWVFSGLLETSCFSCLLLTHEHITLAEEILFLIDEGRGLQLREPPGGRHLLAGLHSLAGNPSSRSEVNAGMHDAEADYFNVIHSSVITNHQTGLCPRYHQEDAIVTASTNMFSWPGPRLVVVVVVSCSLELSPTI